MNFVVTVGFDEAEHRYFVLDSDIPGLNVEGENFEEFMQSALDLAPQLVGRPDGAKIKFEREVAFA